MQHDDSLRPHNLQTTIFSKATVGDMNVSSYQRKSGGYGSVESASPPLDGSNDTKQQQGGREAVWRSAVALGALVCGVFIGQALTSSSYQNEVRWVNPRPVATEQHDTAMAADEDAQWAQIKSDSLVENLENGAVATDDGRCSELGNHILADLGGNAIDAAVAVTLCLGIVNPAGSTPGGGAFVLLHSDAHPERKSADFTDAREHPYEGRAGEKVTEVIDCRETAPLEATMDMFDGQPEDASWTGPLASAVPGQFHCLNLMHTRHGSLPWSQVVKTVVPMARDGVEVSPGLAHAINLKSSKAKIAKNEALSKLLTKNNDGQDLLQEGDILSNPTLAETLEAIAEEGIDALYKGKRAKAIEEEFKRAGGIISAKDLAEYRAVMRDPLITEPGEVKGFTMVGVPPASSGGCVVIGAARLLAGYPEAFATFDDTLSEHRLVEAMKHAYSLRMSLSDPAFFSNITEAAVKDMMEGDFMEQLRKVTKDDSVLSLEKYGGSKWGILDENDAEAGKVEMSEEGHDTRRRRLGEKEQDQSRRKLKGFQYLNDHGTTHIAIVDKDRNAVTMTTTINTYFGSGILSPSTGIIFNSQMDDFASPGAPNHYGVEPSESNYIVAGKKPLSSMSPTLVFRPVEDKPVKNKRDLASQKLVMTFGASGGPKIPTATLQAFVNYFFVGLPLYDAIVRPRIHNQLLYKGFATTLYDRDHLLQGPTIETPERTRNALTKRGQQLAPVVSTGCVQAVAIDMETGLLSAVSDPRKDGRPAGY